MTARRRPLGPPPDAGGLHEAALNYLARYAATEAMLCRVLERRVERWARRAAMDDDAETVAAQAAAARTIVPDVVRRLVAAGGPRPTAAAALPPPGCLQDEEAGQAEGLHDLQLQRGL